MPAQPPRKGRGAASNRASRYLANEVEAIDDGWYREPDAEADPVHLHAQPCRSLLTRNDSPDVPFDRSVNPYRGCEHGCIYCFARPSHAWLEWSPGIDFERQIVTRPNAAEVLRAELAKPSYRPATIAIGANTDAYQPAERRLGITREILELLHEARHPLTIITKSTGVLRDLDLLADMGARGLASVMVSITTLDADLARCMEPRAAAPARRLETLRRLHAAGVPCGVLASPMIPGLNDHELDHILAAAADAGAGSANYILLRLPRELTDLFEEWLRAHYPARADKVLNRLRECRGGALYRSGFGERMTGTGIYAELLAQRFTRACRALGLDRLREDLDTTQFRPPARGGQMALFD